MSSRRSGRDRPATISTVDTFSDRGEVEDVFQLSRQYLNELKVEVADGQKRGYLTYEREPFCELSASPCNADSFTPASLRSASATIA